MRDRIQAALGGSRADYTEIRIEEREATTVAYRGRRLETASSVIDTGGVVRCLVRRSGWGVATFNSLDDLPARVEQAMTSARLAHAEQPIELAPIPVSEERVPAVLDRDFRGISLSDKKALVEAYNHLMLGFSDKIVDTTTRYADSFSRVTFASSEGTFVEQERPRISLSLTARARQGDDVQFAYEGRSAQRGFAYVCGREQLALKAAQRAVELLSAETVVGGQYPVVLNPELAGVFVHEAFGHLSESDFVSENPKAQEMMALGRRFGSDSLTIYDDGAAPGALGTHRYDDEGTPTRRNDLIKNGILVGRLHSRETAARMGEPPTGNARAVSYRFAPIVRMTNTAIEAGTTSFQDLIKDIKLGVYACDAIGGTTALESFSFSSAYAYMIRDGQIAEMVKDVILAGNLFTTLLHIDALGDDFAWDESPGGCGKADQFPLPTAEGSPHIRIQDVMIGGR
jgi:TldD protein